MTKYIKKSILCGIVIVLTFIIFIPATLYAIEIKPIEPIPIEPVLFYVITAETNEGGIIDPCGDIKVPSGSDKEFTITPNNGYKISDVLVNGSSQGDISSYIFENVNSNQTIEVQFTAVSKNDSHISVKAKTEDEEKIIADEEKIIVVYENNSRGFTKLFYNRFFNRDSTGSEIDFWEDRLVKGLATDSWEINLKIGASTGGDIVNRFIFSDECQCIIGGYNNSEFIEYMYRTILNREPELAEIEAWLLKMEGGMGREEVTNCFAHCEEFKDICIKFEVKPYASYVFNS